MQTANASRFATSLLRAHIPARLAAVLLSGMLIVSAGCKKQSAEQPAPRSDEQIASDVQAKITGESALNGQNIQVAVNNGLVTLSGTAGDEASRALAGNDAGAVQGVKTVVNNLTVAPPQVAAAPPPPPSKPATPKPHHHAAPAPPAPAEQPEPAPAPPAPALPAQGVAAAPPPPAPAPAPLPPPPPPKPVAKTVVLPEGTVVPIRMIDSLNSENAVTNQSFRGTLAGDLIADGMIALPQGTTVIGRVVDAKDAAHFKGSALLSIELTAIDSHGRSIPLVTDTYTKEGAGRGKNTAAKTGGGAALGAIIGALAGGGKGAAIGAGAGGGAGLAGSAMTGNRDITIAAETTLNFKLTKALEIPQN